MTAVTEGGHATSGFNIKEWIFTTDHKRIGILYLIGSLAAFTVAGLMALLIRLEQAKLGLQIAETGTQYNTWLYFHGTAMILAFLIPGLTGFAANYLIPLMIGAPDVAFPRVNALSVWLFFAAILIALLTFFLPDAPDVMWTGYPPYSVKTEGNTAFYVFTIHLLGFSSILAAVNFLITVIYMRAPGMGWNQLPMFVWTSVAALALQLVFVPVLAAAVTMVLFDKYLGTNFFNPSEGGDVLLYQNLFWFYSHPAVYVIFLPAMGLLFDIVATMARNRVFNYKVAVYGGIWGIVAISGIVWVHHLYIAGMPNWLRVGMMITTLLISVPVGLLVLSLWGTLYKGAIVYSTAMRYAAACFFLVLLGGLTGIPLALPSITVHLSETSFVHAHFHFIMALFSAFALFGAIYHWFPKMTGRIADSKLANFAFWLNIIGVNVTFWPLFIIGVEGMPRRYADYSMFPQFEPYHMVATFGSWLIAVGMALTFYNWIKAAISGPVAVGNVWNSRSLEWTHTPNPPGPGNFPQPVAVGPDWDPYDYQSPRPDVRGLGDDHGGSGGQGDDRASATVSATTATAMGAAGAATIAGASGDEAVTAKASAKRTATGSGAKKTTAKKPATKKAAPKGTAKSGGKDDLTLISGIGPVIVKKLEKMGYVRFEQIASLTRAQIAEIDAQLDFHGRIEREEWVQQAKELMAGKPPRAASDRRRAAAKKK